MRPKRQAPFMIVLYVALGGAFGAVLRHAAVHALPFGLGTMTVNIMGSFAMGAAFVLLAAKGGWQAFVMTGMLGGFTTFSAFSLDTLKMIETGQITAAMGYTAGTVVLCLAAVFAGALLARALA